SILSTRAASPAAPDVEDRFAAAEAPLPARVIFTFNSGFSFELSGRRRSAMRSVTPLTKTTSAVIRRLEGRIGIGAPDNPCRVKADSPDCVSLALIFLGESWGCSGRTRIP